ncbi:MAG: 2-hydroxychromene-2-carboxylate isomerase [Rhodocyclaceae bacterium]|nr:2-hydroxychromene-2-carboxylate isomerase [Rhodocyclaceae bacterium]
MPDADTPATKPTIEFWFDFGSNYSYISTMRIEAAASRSGLQVRWRPFLLGPIFRSFGWESSPFVLQAAKGEYVWKDMVRECRKAGIAWRKPSVFPRPAVLPLRVALVGAGQTWIGAYCRRMMALNFAEDRDIDSVETVAEVLHGLGLEAGEILAAAQSDANKRRLREQTEAAKALRIFGAPTFLVGDEMFWGNDRLDDAIAEALRVGGPPIVGRRPQTP